MPSNRAALYTMKPTIGLIPQRGIVPVSSLSDSAGPMTKNVKDLVHLLDVLVDKSKTTVPQGGYTAALTNSWGDLKIGVLNPEEWQYNPIVVKPNAEATAQMVVSLISPSLSMLIKFKFSEIRAAYAKIKSLAKVFHENVTLIPITEFLVNGQHVLYKIFGKCPV
jgi:amidase